MPDGSPLPPAVPAAITPAPCLWRHAFGPQPVQGFLGFLQVFETYASEYLRDFRELHVSVLDDLPVVAPGVQEVQAAARLVTLYLGVRVFQRLPQGFAVVHYESYVAMLVRALRAAFGEGEELVAGVNESHPGTATAQLYLEEFAVEFERRFDVADFHGDMVEAEKVCFVRHPPIWVVCSGLR